MLGWSQQLLRIAIGELALLAVCLLGDALVGAEGLSRLQRALADSATHGLVGGLSWWIVLGGRLSPRALAEVGVCVALAAGVDLDHFLAARSFKLEAALSLQMRPPFHNSTLFLLALAFYLFSMTAGVLCTPTPPLTPLLGRASRLCCVVLPHLSLMLVVAWFSHHVRDATRRGLWFAPLGSTPPLPRWVYLGGVLGMPLAVWVVGVWWTGGREALDSGWEGAVGGGGGVRNSLGVETV